MSSKTLVAMVIFHAFLAHAIWAQSSGSGDEGTAPNLQSSLAAVPQIIKFSGTLLLADGRPIAGPIGVTFALYARQSGGAALWMETQNVVPDATGNYTALLGAQTAAGVPTELFVSGKARWLGIQVGQTPEQTRVLLVSVPYAMKALDSETLGGLPPSAFLLANSVEPASPNPSQSIATSGNTITGPNPASPPLAVTTTGGTVNFLPLWTGASSVANSILFQSATKGIGIGNTAPAATLDVTGSGIFRGSLELPAIGTATAAAFFNSQPFDLLASAFSSSTKAAVEQHFRWQAEAVGNNTASPSGKLNLLYASGTGAPAETGVSISNKGLITFAAGQAFPGTGTITGVTTAAGSGLTGGIASGIANLSLLKTCAKGQTLEWSGTAWGCASISVSTGTITGVTAGTGLSGGGTTGKVTLNIAAKSCPAGQALTGLPLTCNKFATTGANTFTGNQTITGDLGVSGNLGGSDANFSGEVMAGTLVSTGNVMAATGKFTGAVATGAQTVTGNITATGNVMAATGKFTGTVATGAQTVTGNITATGNVMAATGKFTGAVATGAQTVTGNVAITGNITDTGNITATGANSVITGVTGTFTASNATQVLSVTEGGSGSGIIGVSTTGEAIVGKSLSAGIGVVGDSTGADGVGVLGNSSGAGGVGVQGISTGARGVQGNSDVLGGVVGTSVSGDGVAGVACMSCSSAAVVGIGKLAGSFDGNVGVIGTFVATGLKSFHIDHPLDPANKYLNHFSMESNEVLNTYSGNLTTDSSGQATVKLPDYFSALNTDYRYQLTVIGQFAQAIIFKEIENNSFVIQTDKPSVKVSWQVTGVRSDANAKRSAMPVEEDKPEQERGYYLVPEIFGQPKEKSIGWLYHPDLMRDARAMQEKAKQQAAAKP